MRILQGIQEEFNADDDLDVQIIWCNHKPLTNYEENVTWMADPFFVVAGAKDIPFFMFDEAYSVRVSNSEIHVLFAEYWGLVDQTDGFHDSALISKDGEVIALFKIFDGASWHGHEVKDFILSNI